ncbi:hypothetical protein [Teredinibacter purpureus]|uniref:hypothetical protein n=1 Tax=Teredinibacter purpureus TaxID=2731756 RepID=UPI0005F76A70|nr:hypothetical protein [Teredinibacter purpureus]
MQLHLALEGLGEGLNNDDSLRGSPRFLLKGYWYLLGAEEKILQEDLLSVNQGNWFQPTVTLPELEREGSITLRFELYSMEDQKRMLALASELALIVPMYGMARLGCKPFRGSRV